MSNSEQSPTIVLDNGSYSLKVGIAGEEVPRHEIPSFLPTNAENDASNLSSISANESTTPQAASELLPDLSSSLVRPIKAGRIVNWDAMEILWKKAFEEALQIPIKEHPLLITESPLNSNEDQRQMTEILFEKFQVSSL